jgi:hypothetical protein
MQPETMFCATWLFPMTFLDLVFKYLIPAKIMQHIEEALLESSDKSWAASAKTLLDAMEDIVNDNIKDKKKGFFGSFFK